MSSEAILYNASGVDPVDERTVCETPEGRVFFVPVSGQDAAAAAAAGLVDEGVHRIELCGALGPRALARVRPAVGAQVPVGACTFGVESVAGAVAFEQRLLDGQDVDVALLYLAAGADSSAGEITVQRGPARLHFVPVPEASAVAGVAGSLAHDRGVDLIELYRDVGPETTGETIDAVAGAAPVGSVLYPR